MGILRADDTEKGCTPVCEYVCARLYELDPENLKQFFWFVPAVGAGIKRIINNSSPYRSAGVEVFSLFGETGSL